MITRVGTLSMRARRALRLRRVDGGSLFTREIRTNLEKLFDSTD